MKLIIMSTGEVTLQIVKRLVLQDTIKLMGVVLDESVNKDYLRLFCEELKKIGVKVLPACDESFCSADAIFVCEYRKLIEANWVERYMFINCHAGILPKWRGFSANAWAIMNGENEIGYTFHRMDCEMDSGEIYYTKKMSIKKMETYADIHDKLLNSIIEDVLKVVPEIVSGKLEGHVQYGERCYGHKFRPEYGELKNFDIKAEYIYNLYRCMAKPLGTGLYFFYKGEKVEVKKVALGKEENVCDYLGIPGKVVNRDDKNRLWVKTRDNVVILELDEPIDIRIGESVS